MTKEEEETSHRKSVLLSCPFTNICGIKNVTDLEQHLRLNHERELSWKLAEMIAEKANQTPIDTKIAELETELEQYKNSQFNYHLRDDELVENIILGKIDLLKQVQYKQGIPVEKVKSRIKEIREKGIPWRRFGCGMNHDVEIITELKKLLPKPIKEVEKEETTSLSCPFDCGYGAEIESSLAFHIMDEHKNDASWKLAELMASSNQQGKGISISKIKAKIKELEAENTRATAYAIDTSYIHVGIILAIDKLKELLPKEDEDGKQ